MKLRTNSCPRRVARFERLRTRPLNGWVFVLLLLLRLLLWGSIDFTNSLRASELFATRGDVVPSVAVRYAPETVSSEATSSELATSDLAGETPDFQRHVVPLLGRLGCNGRSCHGSLQGQGGFQLSLFGYDFAADFASLHKAERPRVDRENPSASLFLRKPTSDNEHEGGRDHYPRCMVMLMAGGGIRGGQVLGASDARASEPLHHGYSPDDVAAPFYHSLGINPAKEYHSDTGRPITLVREGKIIRELLI